MTVKLCIALVVSFFTIFASASAQQAAQVGVQLITSNGTWTGNPTSWTYQWNHCSPTNCTAIPNSTSRTYTPVTGDIGDTINVSVIAHNNVGPSAPQTSLPTLSVVNPPTCLALGMQIVSPSSPNIVTANQITAGALDYISISDSTANVTLPSVPITVNAPGISTIQVWTHGSLATTLTNNGSGIFTGTLNITSEPNGPLLVAFYAYDQVPPTAPTTELIGKYILLVSGSTQAYPITNAPVGAQSSPLTWSDEFNSLNMAPCPPGSYPCVPTSETAIWYPNKGGGGDFGDAAFEHCDPSTGGMPAPTVAYPYCPFTINNGFLRIRMTHSFSYADPYGFGRTWYSGILSTAYTNGVTNTPPMKNGYYEARILFPDGYSQGNLPTSGGSWGAWWLLTVNALPCTTIIGACNPALVNGNDELDIDEQYGAFPSFLTSGSHVYGTNIGTGAYQYHSQPSTDTPVLLNVKDFTMDFHRYGLKITGGTEQLFVDDVPLGTPVVVGLFPGSPSPTINWFMLLNLALGGGWPENAPPAQYYDMWVDYVRYYSLP